MFYLRGLFILMTYKVNSLGKNKESLWFEGDCFDLMKWTLRFDAGLTLSGYSTQEG